MIKNFTYVPAAEVFSVNPGTHLVCIKEVKEEVSKKTNASMVVFYCNVKAADNSWNGVQFRIYAMEGQYYDRQMSRICDCFGVNSALAGDISNWINKIGSVKFDYFKYDAEQKKNVQVAELQNHLLPKAGFKQPETVITESTPAVQQDFGEDIPF